MHCGYSHYFGGREQLFHDVIGHYYVRLQNSCGSVLRTHTNTLLSNVFVQAFMMKTECRENTAYLFLPTDSCKINH